MFKALRMQMDELGMAPDYKVSGLSALPDILSAIRNQQL
jgi:2-haloacid dehalogenase